MQSLAKEPVEQEKHYSWDETIKTVFYALLFAVLFRSFAYEPFHIPSGSMKNGLLVGDYLFVSKFSYGYSRYSFPFGLPLFEGRIGSDDRPQRGDVVVFRLPANPRIDFIKRVMGLPGDRIQLREGVVYINNEPLPRAQIDDYPDDESGRIMQQFIETLPEGRQINILHEEGSQAINTTPAYTIPPGYYFMMGDNRDNSRDSRYMREVGLVPEENIVGRASIIWFSIDGSARLINPLSWPGAIRWSRFLTFIK